MIRWSATDSPITDLHFHKNAAGNDVVVVAGLVDEQQSLSHEALSKSVDVGAVLHARDPSGHLDDGQTVGRALLSTPFHTVAQPRHSYTNEPHEAASQSSTA